MEIAFGVVSFTAIVLALVLFVLTAKRILVPSGVCEIAINHIAMVVGRVNRNWRT